MSKARVFSDKHLILFQILTQEQDREKKLMLIIIYPLRLRNTPGGSGGYINDDGDTGNRRLAITINKAQGNH